MIVDEDLEYLSESQCLALLADGDVGRVGVTMGALPAIFPVNYRLIDGAIVFRTSPGSKLSAAVNGAVVAFEVDDYHLGEHTGWSVLAVGPSEVVHDLSLAFRILEEQLQPLAEGRRSTIVRIRPSFVSGRRIARGSHVAAN